MAGVQDRRWEGAGTLTLAAFAVLAGCGAKTDLWMPDVDAGPPDCSPTPLALRPVPPEVMFLVDRSGSMDWRLDADEPATDGELSRWRLLEQTLAAVLAETDPTVRVGAKFFPAENFWPPGSWEPDMCRVEPSLDLEPIAGRLDRLLSFFRTTSPLGGTPTAEALEEVRIRFARRSGDGVPRFVVLATDGGPNCNPDPEIPPPDCYCTGQPYTCDPSPRPVGVGETAALNCLDEDRTIDRIEFIFRDSDVPVYVIGLGSPSRPELLDVLDRMAVAGGRPRPDGGERRFYDVQEPEDLRSALDTITRSILRCTLQVSPPGPDDPTTVFVTIDGRYVRHDHLRDDGWDFTNDERTELTLFGTACAEMMDEAAEIAATVECPE